MASLERIWTTTLLVCQAGERKLSDLCVAPALFIMVSESELIAPQDLLGTFRNADAWVIHRPTESAFLEKGPG